MSENSPEATSNEDDNPREALAAEFENLRRVKAKEERSQWFAQFYRIERVNNHIAERLRAAMESTR